MNTIEFAEKLDGMRHGQEIPQDLAFEADDHGLVVVFGSSDGLTRVRGAIWDETRQSVIIVTQNGLADGEETCRISGNKIKPVRNMEGYRLIYETTIPHAIFDIIENREKHCRGIVFSLSDLKSSAAAEDLPLLGV